MARTPVLNGKWHHGKRAALTGNDPEKACATNETRKEELKRYAA